MAIIRTVNGYERLSDAKLIVRSNEIVAAMTGNTNFATPVPSLANITAAITLFSQCVDAASTGNKYSIITKNEKRNDLIDLLHLLSYYVLYTAAGDRNKAASSGIELAKSPEPLHITTPQNLKVVNGDNPGTLLISVKSVKGACSYIHQYTTDATLAEGSWLSHTCSSSKCEIGGLVPGTKYYVRVIVVGTGNQVKYSTVASRIAV